MKDNKAEISSREEKEYGFLKKELKCLDEICCPLEKNFTDLSL